LSVGVRQASARDIRAQQIGLRVTDVDRSHFNDVCAYWIPTGADLKAVNETRRDSARSPRKSSIRNLRTLLPPEIPTTLAVGTGVRIETPDPQPDEALKFGVAS
jgi:hypothetical protein